MATDGSRLAVVSALGGNAVLTVGKFVAFGMTGSGAMLSEGIHSFADVMNQALLLLGIVRSGKAADDEHQYGYGRERFVWALISAVGIFFLGCGVTIYHGISSLLTPHEINDIGWAIGVLVVSLIVEGVVLAVAFKGLYRARGDRPFLTYLRTDADPAAVAVLLEDLAACIGVIIAMVCLLLAKLTGQVWWDAVGSILIGLLLGAVAIWLIARNRDILVGRTMPDTAKAKVRNVLMKSQTVDEIIDIKSELIDMQTYDVLIGVRFNGARLAARLEEPLKNAWPAMNSYDDFRGFIDTYTDDILVNLSAEIDRIEAEIRQAVPEVKHIDIEPEIG